MGPLGVFENPAGRGFEKGRNVVQRTAPDENTALFPPDGVGERFGDLEESEFHVRPHAIELETGRGCHANSKSGDAENMSRNLD